MSTTVSVWACANLADLVYNESKDVRHADDVLDLTPTVFEGWSRQDWLADAGSGFYGAIYQKSNEIIVAFRGSKGLIKDWLDSDVDIARRELPAAKVEAAVKLYDRAKQVSSGRQITLVGHSLGGGLAQVVAAAKGLPCVTFNAPGMKKQMRNYIDNLASISTGHLTDQIVNFRASQDPVSAYAGEHLGVVYHLNTYESSPFTHFVGKLGRRLASHKMGGLIEYVAKQSWKDKSPFDNKGYWSEISGGVVLP
jgi:hypothetical protein